jgi:hypothetical protein
MGLWSNRLTRLPLLACAVALPFVNESELT